MDTAPALAATFEGARPVAVDPDDATVTIGFPSDKTFNKRKAESQERRETIAEALTTVLGEKLRPVFVLMDGESDTAEAAPTEEGVDHDELVAKLKTEFDAEEVVNDG